MHTVVETPNFLADCKAAGVSDGEKKAIVDYIAANPQAGDLIVGTGGARRLRFAKQGGGKSGGWRTIHYFAGDDVPVFLLMLYGKSVRENISPAERNRLQVVLDNLAESYRKGDDMTKFGQRLIESAEQALAFARGEAVEGFVVHEPPTVDVRAIRRKTGLSQARFAARFGFTADAVRNWEQGRRRPEGPARVLLKVIEREPEAVLRALAEEPPPATSA
jgi:hypothetical protein